MDTKSKKAATEQTSGKSAETNAAEPTQSQPTTALDDTTAGTAPAVAGAEATTTREQRDISAATNTTALATPRRELAKNFASPEEVNEAAKAFGYDKLDSAATKKEFHTLDGELNKRKDAIAAARVTLEEATPYLAKMQALLSQRGADRKKVLHDAKVPRWTEWAEAYAKELNYTVRSIQNRIKELREGKKDNGTGDDHTTPPAHYTKPQTDEMVSTCNLAIEAKKASEAGRPVDAILAKIKMDGKRLLEINETAQQLPDYRKCTERMLSVTENYAKGEVPAAKIVEVANDIRKQVTPKQADASLTEAAQRGKKKSGKAALIPPRKSVAPLPKTHPLAKARGKATSTPSRSSLSTTTPGCATASTARTSSSSPAATDPW